MRWADALAASKNKKAHRTLIDELDQDEPNRLLIDPKFNPIIPKAFHTNGTCAWGRVKLRFADRYDDWEPD